LNGKIKLAFDLDDILIDLIPAWLNYINIKHGTNKKPEDIKSWSISNYFRTDIRKGLLSKEDLYKPLVDDDFWRQIKPIEGMHDILKHLKDTNIFDIYIATASNYHTIKSKLNNCVLKYYGDIINEDHIILINDKSMLNADILVDDYFGNINNFLKSNKNSIGLVKNTPHSDIDFNALNNTHVADYKHLSKCICYSDNYDFLIKLIHMISEMEWW
jgi:5'(3')-deoxyribonucleotidase